MGNPLRAPAGGPRLPAAILLVGLALCCPARAQDPFAPGERWQRSASPLEPWIPRSLAFGGDDGFVWASANGGAQHLELLSSAASGTNTPLLRDDTVANALGVLTVAAGRSGTAFFSAVQLAAPDAQHRVTRVSRYDPLTALSGASFVPAWTFDAGFTTNGPARLACDEDGARAVLALWNSGTANVRVVFLDAANGALLHQIDLAGAALNEIALSADGRRLALVLGLDLWVLDEQANVRHHELVTSATQALSLTKDGALLALGAGAHVRLLDEINGHYQPFFQVSAASNELASRTALSADARTLGIGWWDAQSGVSLRFEVLDVVSQTRLWQQVQTGTNGGLQNLPEVVRASPDGQRVAFGCWGDGTQKPEVVLFDRASASAILSINLPGSVQSLALDRSGTRIAVGFKDVHANQLGGSGAIRLYDTGESDLTALDAAHHGRIFDLAAKRAGSSSIFFLLGPRNPNPLPILGTQGTLMLLRNALSVYARPADASGRADLALPVPADPALIGTEWHVQAAFRGGGVLTFGETVLDPWIL